MHLWRRHLGVDEARAVALLAGGVVLIQTAGTLGLWLVNGDGPFDQRRLPGSLIALGAGLAAGLLALLVVRVVARTSGVLLVVLVVLLGSTTWVLLPSRIDVGESVVPRPGPRWSCTGWTFSTYPIATMDASSSRWCIGLEHRIADG